MVKTEDVEERGSTLAMPGRTTLHTPSISYAELAYTIDSVGQVFSLSFTSQVAAFGWDEDQWMEIWGP